MQLYNSLTGKKEPLPHATNRHVRLFVCGPTVYDDAHIGHARTYVFFDVFARALRQEGVKLFYLQNITDVDDKIIRHANEAGVSPLAFARKYTKRYLEDMRALGIRSVTKYVPATKFIKEIVRQVQALIAKDYAYEIPGDGYYFDIAKDPEYGKLSGRTALQAEDAVSRIDESIGKRNKGDFCVWKFSKPGEPMWKTSLGAGRPGWHIEDTAISEYYFGAQYEIHGGGLDLKFPHHEAEIAQQESASGKKPFVRLWMHTGILSVDGTKMSKSLGNFITVREFLKKHSPAVFRMIVLTHHYRSPLNYSADVVSDHEKILENLSVFIAKLEMRAKTKRGAVSHELYRDACETMRRDFWSALDDDMNTPRAIASIFEFINTIQPKFWELSPKEARTIKKAVLELLSVLGIELVLPEIPRKIKVLAARREQYRANKQFVPSDGLRKEIDALGYGGEDTPLGPFVWPKRQP